MKTKWLLVILAGFLIWSFNASAQQKSLKDAVKPAVVKKEAAPTVKVTSSCVGNCVDGWGKQEYDNGYYYGFWANGLKNGFGIYFWDKGDTYSGDWKNDLISGFGSYNHVNGDGYDGSFKNGLKHGLGRYYDKAEDQVFYDEYKNGVVVKTLTVSSNSVTTGCIDGNCDNGFGHYIFKSGDYFDGEFANGKLKSGSYRFASGDLYIGEFNSSTRFEGYGLYIYKNNGGKYAGKWVNGKRNGRGRSEFNDIIQIGEWVDDKLVKNLDF